MGRKTAYIEKIYFFQRTHYSNTKVFFEELNKFSWQTKGIPGLNSETYKKWMKHGARPNGNNLLKLDCLAKLFGLSGYDCLLRDEDEPIDPALNAFFRSKGKNTTLKSCPQNIEAIVFDLEGTLIQGFQHSWEELFSAIDKTEERQLLLDSYQDKKKGISYAEFCEQALIILRESHLKFTDISRILRDKGFLVPGVIDSLMNLRSQNVRVGLVSGGIDLCIDIFFREQHNLFDFISINKLSFDETGMLDTITPFITESKTEPLIEFCEQFKISPKNVMYFGDNQFDVPMKDLGLKLFSFKGAESIFREKSTHIDLYNLTSVLNKAFQILEQR